MRRKIDVYNRIKFKASAGTNITQINILIGIVMEPVAFEEIDLIEKAEDHKIVIR